MTKNNILAIRISDNSLSFAAEDTNSEHGLTFEPYIINSSISMAANLRKAFDSSVMLASGHRCCTVLVSSKVMILPIDDFSEETKELLYYTTFSRQPRQTIVSCVVPQLSCVAVFAIDSDIKTVIDDHFHDVRIMPMTLPVWTFLNTRSYNNTHRKLYAYIHDGWLDVFAFHQNRFKFCNCFRAYHHQDVAYYLTNVWTQLGYDQEKDELHISCKAEQKEQIVEYAQKFLKNVYTIRPRADFNRHKYCDVAALPYDLLTFFVNA